MTNSMKQSGQLNKKRGSSQVNRVRVAVANDRYRLFCKASIGRLPNRERKRFDLKTIEQWSRGHSRHTEADYGSTVVISCLEDQLVCSLNKMALGTNVKYVLFPEDLPCEAIPDKLLKLNVRTPQKLHLAHEKSGEKIEAIISRFLTGSYSSDANYRIVDAWIEGADLVLLSPSFHRMRIPLEKLESKIGSKPEKIRAFEIDEDGSFLYWSHADVHLGFEQFQHLVDPMALLRAKQKNQEYNRNYGAAIKQLRIENELKQTDIQGVTARNLRRVEKGELAASSALLKSLSKAHKMELKQYLKEIALRFRSLH